MYVDAFPCSICITLDTNLLQQDINKDISETLISIQEILESHHKL